MDENSTVLSPHARITVWKIATLLVQLLQRFPKIYMGTATRQMKTCIPPTIQNTSFGPCEVIHEAIK